MMTRNKITYYDFADIRYSSFFLTGFLENQGNYRHRLVISRKAPSLLRDPMVGGEWKDLLFSICLFKANLIDDTFYFCIDTRDSCKADPNRGMGYHIPLLKKVKYYFKVNYNDDAIRCDPTLRLYSSKIIPVPLFFPLKIPQLLSFFPRISPCSVTGWTFGDAKKRIAHLRGLLSLEEIKELRNVEKDLDLFLVTSFYPQPEHSAAMEFRYKIMKEIRKHKNLVSVTGFATSYNKKLPGEVAEFQCERYSPRNYLKNLARAKIAIYVKGLWGCLSFKFGELLALGMPIVGQTITNNKSQLSSNEHFRNQFAYDDPKEIFEKATKLLTEPIKMKRLSELNAATFDAKFTPQAVTAEILERLM